MKVNEFIESDLVKKFGKDDKLQRILENFRSCYQIQQIVLLRKRLYSHTPCKYFLGNLLNEPCKKCGKQEVYCGHADLGGEYLRNISQGKSRNNYYNFWHICLNCLDANHIEKFTQFGDSERDSKCPFCERELKWGSKFLTI